jgi:hypothetical protein
MVLADGAIRMLGLMHTLVEHIPQHEHVPMCNAIVLMEVEYDLVPSLKIFGKPMLVF